MAIPECLLIKTSFFHSMREVRLYASCSVRKVDFYAWCVQIKNFENINSEINNLKNLILIYTKISPYIFPTLYCPSIKSHNLCSNDLFSIFSIEVL